MPEEIPGATHCDFFEENPAISLHGDIEHYQVSQRFFFLFFYAEVTV
jgi:hypothetical protein